MEIPENLYKMNLLQRWIEHKKKIVVIHTSVNNDMFFLKRMDQTFLNMSLCIDNWGGGRVGVEINNVDVSFHRISIGR